MKIGLQIPNFTWPGGPREILCKIAEIARTADEAGFSSLWVMDHFFQIPSVGPAEREMLECALDPHPNSRLSCQIELTDALDGLTVDLPASQY